MANNAPHLQALAPTGGIGRGRRLRAGRLQAGWEKLEHYGVTNEVTDGAELRDRAVEQHLKALRAGKTSLIISPRHEEARKVAAVVRQQLKAEGAISAEDHVVTALHRMDLGPEASQDLLHYAPSRTNDDPT